EIVDRRVHVGEALDPAGSDNFRIDDRGYRSAVPLVAVTAVVRVLVNELVSARANEPVDEILVWVFALAGLPEMFVRARVDVRFRTPQRLFLRAVQSVPLAVPGEVVRHVDANARAVREYKLKARLPVFDGHHRLRGRFDQIRPIAPLIVVAEDVAKPLHFR